MQIPSTHRLVNFRASKSLLESFDRVNLLSGKTRTQAFSEMMRNRVTKAGPKLAIEAVKEKAVFDGFKTAVERQSEPKRVETPRTWSPAVLSRLKPFSSFSSGGER